MVALWMLICACGELDNAPIAEVLHREDVPGPACSELLPSSLGPAVAPPAVVGVPWAGFLHAVPVDGEDVPLVWTITGLPPGVALVEGTGWIEGRPSAWGIFEVTATATVLDCTASLEFELDVSRACDPTAEACAALSCDQIDAAEIQVEVLRTGSDGVLVGIPPGEAFAREGLQVLVSNEHRGPGVAADRRMILVAPGSKDQVIVNYSIPGGVNVPLEGDQVDLRYIHGLHDDHYLFITRNGAPRFVVYDGHLPPGEIALRCPEDPLKSGCPVIDYALLPTGCADACDGRRHLAVEMTVDDPDPRKPIQIERLLVAGEVARRGGQLIRLVSAFERGPGVDCTGLQSPLSRVAFYTIPVAACAVCEIVTLAEPDLFAPTGAVFRGRVLFPFEFDSVSYAWTAELPVDDAVLGKVPGDAGEFWLEMPLVGEYRARATCTVEADGKQIQSCLGRPAEVTRTAVPAEAWRVEAVWNPVLFGASFPSPPLLTVGDTVAEEDGLRVLGVDLTVLAGASDIVVHHVAAGADEPAVSVHVRVWASAQPAPLGAELVHDDTRILQAGQVWTVGRLSGGGFGTLEAP